MFRMIVTLLLAAALGGQACTQPSARQSWIVVRDAETETLLRTIANPLFRAAGVDPGMVRIILLRDDAINSFVSTGNRMFINTGLIACANLLAGKAEKLLPAGHARMRASDMSSAIKRGNRKGF
jgi:predicted Zn-dependent protease